MPLHLELGSDGHSFHGKAIVVNSVTGKHYSHAPIPLQKAEAQKRVIEGAMEKHGEHVTASGRPSKKIDPPLKVSAEVAQERRARHEAKKLKAHTPTDESMKAVESIGSWAWAWKRMGWVGGEKLKAGGYSIVQNNTVFTVKGVDKIYPQYWSEWTPLIGKEVVMPTPGFMDDGNRYLSKIKVRANGTVVVQIPGKGDKDKADEWFENDFGWTLMHHPNKAVVAEPKTPVSDIKAKLEHKH